MHLRLPGLMYICGAALLALPTRAHAQDSVPARPVTPADLVGSWARQGEKEPYITFRTDSTVVHVIQTPDGNGVAIGRWWMNRDTLILSGMRGKVGTVHRKVITPPRLVKLENTELTITRLPQGDIPYKKQVYVRVADSLRTSAAQ